MNGDGSLPLPALFMDRMFKTETLAALFSPGYS